MVSTFTVLVVADGRPNPPPIWIAYVVGAVIALICMRSISVELYQMRVYRRVYVDTWNLIDLAVVGTTAGLHSIPTAIFATAFAAFSTTFKNPHFCFHCEYSPSPMSLSICLSTTEVSAVLPRTAA